ncbi:hypothetical protein DL768_009538 [Monosporascus sp. mg162]|nr:hypothetical protein DL768_009538 [Monosporascus sp. mg162]
MRQFFKRRLGHQRDQFKFGEQVSRCIPIPKYKAGQLENDAQRDPAKVPIGHHPASRGHLPAPDGGTPLIIAKSPGLTVEIRDHLNKDRNRNRAATAYPERLCIYHAGTGRTTFLACLKLSTLFIFAFFGFVVTPAYFDKEGFSVSVARTTASALVPLIFVAYTTSPFVSFIHIRLPPFARQSEEMLRRFVQNLPPKTELDITTMSFIAKPRLSKVAVSDLRAANKRLGIVNYTRDTAAENAARKWYMFPAVGNFSIQGNKMPRLPWVWEHVANTLARQRA